MEYFHGLDFLSILILLVLELLITFALLEIAVFLIFGRFLGYEIRVDIIRVDLIMGLSQILFEILLNYVCTFPLVFPLHVDVLEVSIIIILF